MKKFKFRLEPLLTLKKRKEDEEIRNFSIIVSEINNKSEEIDNLTREIQSVGDSISRKIGTGASLRDYAEYSDISRFLNLKINTLEEEIERKQPELQSARELLNRATREKKILELLKDKAKKDHKKKLDKEERKELEEYVTLHSFLNSQNEEKPSQKSFSEQYEEWKLYEEEDVDSEWGSDEVKAEEKELSEYEKLQKYYDDLKGK